MEPLTMGLDAIIFMGLTWLVVIGLNIYCFGKIFGSNNSNKK